MTNYEKARVKLSNNQLKKLDYPAKKTETETTKKTETTWRIQRKNFKMKNCHMSYF